MTFESPKCLSRKDANPLGFHFFLDRRAIVLNLCDQRHPLHPTLGSVQTNRQTMPSFSLAPIQLEDALLPSHLDIGEVADCLRIMRIQEETSYRIRDYLSDSAGIRKRASKPVDADCRIKMCEWCYQVVDFCKFRRETVGIGMSYLDRYLSTSEGRSALCNRKEYQLAAMTALYVAIKLHEPLEMETSLLADLSRGCYNEMEFVEMEQVILLSLKWRVNGPTALGFVQHYLTFLPDSVHPCVSEAIFDYARYQIELATADQSFVNIRPSEVGLAALLNALEGIDTKLLSFKIQSKFIRNIERFSEMVVEDVESLQAKLSLMLINMLSLELSEFVDVAIEQEALAEREFLDGDDDYKPSIISRRNSPVSVIRGR
jgi:Cyclin, N-terminal domain/Cyclin, C-terminal domain